MGVKNINVVYNVDTSSVKVATNTVTQAKLATDQLTQSAINLGTAGSAGSQKFASDIYTLRIQMQQLKTQIELTSQADTATLTQRIALYKDMEAQMAKYNAGLQTTAKTTQDVGSSMVTLGNTVRAVITAGLLREVISVNLEMAKLAGQVDGVKRAFDKLPNSTILFKDLREATHGTIDDLTLMQKAVQAQNFKIPLEQLATLLEFASIKAQQTGLDIDYLTNSLITGLGRNSIRLLDNLQISVTELREKTKELGSQQKAVFFLVNEQMKTMGGYLDNSATKVDQLTASWKNLKIAASQTLASSGFVSFLDKIVDGYTKMFKGQKQVDDEFNQDIAIKYAKEFLTEQNSNIEAIDKQIVKLKEEMQVRGALKATIKEQMAAPSQQGTMADRFAEREFQKNQLKVLGDQNDIAQKEIAILKQKQLQIEATNGPQKEQIGIIEALDEKIKSLNEDLVKATSRSQIIDIQIRIKTAEGEKADLLDPDRKARQAKKAFDEANESISEGIRSNTQTIIKEANKGAKAIDELPLFKQLQKNFNEELKGFLKGIQIQHKDEEQEQAAHQARMNRLMRFTGSQLYTNARQIANILVQNDVDQYDQQLQALQDFYSNQQALAGTNTKVVQRLQKEEAEKQKQLENEKAQAQKKANIRKIEIDTAANVIRSILENGGIPWGLPFGGIAAAMGLFQIAAVNKFAEGVIGLKGPGHDTSDNIPSMLSPGESVMTAKETRESGNILRSIRAKKLNDEILDKLTITTDGVQANFDDSRIVNELKKGRSPDYARQFSTLYEVKESGKGMKRIIRSKSFNN